MAKRLAGGLFNIALLLAAVALPARSHAETTGSTSTPLPTANARPAAAAPAASMTREKASTECWMRYEKEGRGLSLDKRLPLVEKCTAEKLKTGR